MYALVWETGPLIEVGQAFVKLLAKNGAQLAAQWALSASALTAGVPLPINHVPFDLYISKHAHIKTHPEQWLCFS